MSASTSGRFGLRPNNGLARLNRAAGRHSLFLGIVLIVALMAAWPLLSGPGLLNTSRGGGDSPFLLQRVHQMEQALLGGHFPARWMPDANYGYGFPFYHYYAPLSFYLAGALRILGLSYVGAIKLTQLCAFLVAAAAMYQLGRHWFNSPWAGLLASAAYTLAPFHLINVYVRGDSLAEFWAMAFYPVTLLAADRINEPGRRQQAWFALAYAALVLSHNISALIFSPFLLLYMMLRWWRLSQDQAKSGLETRPDLRRRLWATLGLAAAGLLALGLGLALAAHFFLPALAERELAQLGPATEGHFFYGNHFRDLDLVQMTWLFDYDPADGKAFRIGLAQAVMAAAGGIVLLPPIRKKLSGAREQDEVIGYRKHFILATMLITIFMMTSLSRPLWEQLPLLSFTQFPWRFMSVQAVGFALATAGLALLPGRRILVLAVVGLLLVANLAGIETAYLGLTDADITAEKLAEYEWFTGNIGSTVSAEYLPGTVQPRSYTSRWLTYGQRDYVQALQGELLAAELIQRTATRQSWQVSVAGAGVGRPAIISLPTIHWPGWQAAIDGQPLEIYPAPGSGLITLDLPAGAHQIDLWLGRTPVRTIAELVSLVALLYIFWQLRPVRFRRAARVAMVAVLLLAAIAIGLRLIPDRPLAPGTLSWDFGQMGFLHHQPEGIRFDNGLRLMSYQYSQDEMDAGETLVVTMEWAVPDPAVDTQISLALAPPAITRFSAAPLLALQQQPWPARLMRFELSIPENAPGGLYLPRLTMSDGQALMSEDRLRGDLFLRPVRIHDQMLPADALDPPFAVRTLQVEQVETALELQLAWLRRQPTSHNYNVTLRLADADGRLLRQFDIQPGYGFLPSMGWPTDHWVNDWLSLELPPQKSEKAPYSLMTQLYDVVEGNVVLTRYLGQLVPEGQLLAFRPHVPQFELKEEYVPVNAIFHSESGPIIRLRGYHMSDDPQPLNLTLYWEALEPGKIDYTRFVHLIDPATTQPPLVQSDEMPRHNSYPTGQWIAGEIVADEVSLDLGQVAPGQYQIVVGLYRNLGDRFPRLAVFDGAGSAYSDARIPLLSPIIVEP